MLAPMVLLPLGVAGCKGNNGRSVNEPGDGPRSGGVVTIGWTTSLNNINPLLSAGNVSSDEVFSQLFLQLRKEQPDFTQHPPRLEPQLARSYEWSSDHRVLTFYLRPDVLWSDGVPVSAEDVRWTWEAQRDKSIDWAKSYTKDAIDNVEVVNPNVVRFHFSHVYSKQLLDANEGVILPKHAWNRIPFDKWRSNSEWFGFNLVVNGPFTIGSWKPDYLVLKRNKNYYNSPLPFLDKVIFKYMPSTGDIDRALIAGDVDFTPQVSPESVGKIVSNPDLELITYWHRLVVGVAWNSGKPPFDRYEVRRAIAMGIDKEKIVKDLFATGASSANFGRVATSPIGASVWAHNFSIAPAAYDPKQARQALETLGFVSKKDSDALIWNGVPFSFELETNSENAQRMHAADIIAKQLSAIGIDVRVKKIRFRELENDTNVGNFDAAIVGLSLDTSLDLTGRFHSRSIKGGSNVARYSNPVMDQLMERSVGRLNILESRNDLNKIQEILDRDQPYTWLWESQRLNAVNRRVRDVRPNATSSLSNLEEWWVKQ